ncbi:hypothetical protein [Paenibacillus tundrae]|uniref:Transcription elongation factor Elf1 n=1 Tax=Paenibacillus tundrae TaxID=528187 RepID=A0ABT9WBZ0_9BACL|nr:hypothetical protein [Paenibacillus tundrae]MDQ0170552.1 transcription elongation factor Elf1 [Paenibacillus tundrae]
MGVAGKLSCKQCSYSQNVFFGIGFKYIDLNRILEWYEQEEGRQQIKEFINKENTEFECYDGLYVCEQCKYILNSVFLHINSKDSSYTNSYDCPRCNMAMPKKPVLDDVNSGLLDCPDCKEEKLEMHLNMDWD